MHVDCSDRVRVVRWPSRTVAWTLSDIEVKATMSAHVRVRYIGRVFGCRTVRHYI
jgi:hypothetical protein